MRTRANSHRRRQLAMRAVVAVTGVGCLVTTAPAAIGNTHTPTVWTAHPDPTAEGVALVAVDADRALDAWAVGQHVSVKHPGRVRAAVEHWDGERWRGAPPPSGAVDLSSVSSRSPKDVWVGGLRNENTGPIVVWHFNGKIWTRISSRGLPHLNSGNVLAAGSHVWLAGAVDTGRTDGGAVIATYLAKAKKWSVQRADRGGGFFGVTALSATSAWAVGSTSQYADDGHPLIAHWDGSSWTTKTFPDTDGELVAVAAHSDTEAMAVGNSSRRFTMNWDGAEWTPEPVSPDRGYVFTAVSAGPGTEYWAAVGGTSGGAAFHARFMAGQWRTVRGAQGSVEVASHRKYHDPDGFAVARVPNTTTTLSVGAGTRAGSHHLSTPAAALESTDQ
jgi:hypothetical protein